MVGHDHNRIVTVGGGEVGDEVHGRTGEGFRSGIKHERHEWRSGGVSVDFHLLASATAVDVSRDECKHAWPPVVAFDELEGFEATRMASGFRVMVASGNGTAEVFVWRDITAVLEEDEASGWIGTPVGQRRAHG